MVAEQGLIRNRVGLEKFKGGENFQGWSTRFKSMIVIIDQQYEALFERLTDPFIAAHLTQLCRPPGKLVPLAKRASLVAPCDTGQEKILA